MTEDEKFRAELHTVRDQVALILDRYPEARNNDFYLQLLWLKLFSGIAEFKKIWVQIEDVERIQSKLETVTRVRRKLQHEGWFMPTRPDVFEKRKMKQEVMRRVFGTEEWSGDQV